MKSNRLKLSNGDGCPIRMHYDDPLSSTTSELSVSPPSLSSLSKVEQAGGTSLGTLEKKKAREPNRTGRPTTTRPRRQVLMAEGSFLH
eukprot:scaffold12698_cov207-Alexandrium_tamarense.AAC.9